MGKCTIEFVDLKAGEIDVVITFDPPIHKNPGERVEDSRFTPAQRMGKEMAAAVLSMMTTAADNTEGVEYEQMRTGEGG